MAHVVDPFGAVSDGALWCVSTFHLSLVNMDTLNALLLGWLVFGTLILILAKFLYERYLRVYDEVIPDFDEGKALGAPAEEGEKTTVISEAQIAKENDEKIREALRNTKLLPKVLPRGPLAPVATGGDPDAVRWVNNVLVWMFAGGDGSHLLRETWNDALNEFTVGVALEAGVLVEIIEFLPQTQSPILLNTVIDCSPKDEMILSCDIESCLYLRIQTTRTQRELTTESEYVCAVRPLRGRLNCTTNKPHLNIALNMDGWPDVSLELEGIRNNSSGLDEKQLQTVISEVIIAALRKVPIELDFYECRNYPKFSRARSLPDHIVPVGYDALIREQQTHPPSFDVKKPTSRHVSAGKETSSPVSKPNQEDPWKKTPTSNPNSAYRNAEFLGTNTLKPTAPNVKMIPPIKISVSPSISPKLDRKNIKNSLMPTYIIASSVGSSSIASEMNNQKDHGFSSHQPIDHDDSPIVISDSNSKFTEPLESSRRMSDLDMLLSSPTVTGNRVNNVTLTSSEEALVARNIERYENESSVPDTEDIRGILTKYNKENEHKKYIEDDYLDRGRSPKRGRTTNERRSTEGIREPMKESSNLSSSLRQKAMDDIKVEVNLDRNLSMPSPTAEDSFEDDDVGNPLKDLKIPLTHTPFNSVASHYANLHQNAPLGIVGLNGKRLLVKVVKASCIGADRAVVKSHCVAEMDDPPQKFVTTDVVDTPNPFWDEQFLFELSDNTLELLFEIYGPEAEFYGLGIVGIEELVATPSQRQIIPLQARPYEKEEISGSLTCEFLFLDRADLPDLLGRSRVGRSSPAKNFTEDLGTDLVSSGEEDEKYFRPSLQDTNRNQEATRGSTKSTIVIQASRKPMSDPRYELLNQDENTKPGLLKSDAFTTNYLSPNTLLFTAVAKGNSEGSLYSSSRGSNPSPAPSPANAATQAVGPEFNPDDPRGRSRKKRSFFGSIKRKFSRSKNRSKSVEPTSLSEQRQFGARVTPDRLAGRSVSVERSTSMTKPDKGFLKVPGRVSTPRKSSNIPYDEESTVSSLSGASGLSSTSAKTYVNEASSLVVETLENGVIIHYLVPYSLQRSNKWRKKGTKLHIYNEHTFVAKHLQSSILCEVCAKSIGRRIGKQGYECRDCSMKCHKPCHVRIDTVCPTSTANSMNLVYVKDERAAKKKGTGKTS